MLQFMDALEYGDELIFLNSNDVHIFAANIEDKKIRYAGGIAANWMKSPMRKIFMYNNELYMISYAGLIIYKCTENHGYFEGSVIYHDDSKNDMRVIAAFLNEDKIYNVPYSTKQDILCYDIAKNKIVKQLRVNSCSEIESDAIISDAHLYEGNIFFSIKNNHVLYKVDIGLDNISNYINASFDIGGFNIVKDDIWLRQANGYSVEKINKNGERCLYPKESCLQIDNEEINGKIKYVDGRVMMLPGTSNTIGLFDNNMNVKTIDLAIEFQWDETNAIPTFSLGGMQIGEDYLIFPWKYNGVIKINTKNNTCSVLDIDYEGDIKSDYQQMILENYRVIHESPEIELSFFIKNI